MRVCVKCHPVDANINKIQVYHNINGPLWHLVLDIDPVYTFFSPFSFVDQVIQDYLSLDKKRKQLIINGAITYILDKLEVIHILSLHTVCQDTLDLH